MEFSTDLCFAEDSIEPCRTCGIYFTHGLDMDQQLVRPLFDAGDAAYPAGMGEILEQMSAWKMQVARDDGRPQFMCITCIAEFQKLLKFKRSCLETQEQFGEMELQREHNSVIIKREIDAEADENEKFCGFVYLDISDEEAISDEDGSRRVSAAFDIPHVPIKEEHMARVPIPNKATFLPPERKESNDELTNMFSASSVDANSRDDTDDEEEEEEEAIIKFTYDDDAGEAASALPQPIKESPASVLCKLCSYDSPNEEAHLEHMQRMHLLKDWECHICAKKFVNAPESRLKFHMKWHKLQRHVKCPMCGFFCSSKETLKEHKKAVHTSTKCSVCSKNIRTNLMQRHLRTHLDERQAELEEELKLLQQQTQIYAGTSLPPRVPTASGKPLPPAESTLPAASTTLVKEDSCVSASTEDMAAERDSTVAEHDSISAAKDSTTAERDSFPAERHSFPAERDTFPAAKDSTTAERDPFPAEKDLTPAEKGSTSAKKDSISTLKPPLADDSLEPAFLNDISIVQCAFCSDTFNDTQQLEAHVLATHRRATKRLHSPDKTPPPIQPAKVRKPETESLPPMEETTMEISSSSLTDASLNGSSQSCEEKQQNENNKSKSYLLCPLCHKTFNLKFKLNRHMQNHKAPF